MDSGSWVEFMAGSKGWRIQASALLGYLCVPRPQVPRDIAGRADFCVGRRQKPLRSMCEHAAAGRQPGCWPPTRGARRRSWFRGRGSWSWQAPRAVGLCRRH